ncbi:MAG TPA: hypothetical protein V6D12_14280 [Candidatus Obscuribacterales bacterium]
MNAIEKYEGITGEDLPRKAKRINNPEYLPMLKFFEMFRAGEVVFDGPNAWGSVKNNPCELYRHKDGRWIECYTPCLGGMETFYIEKAEGEI